jgi:hypothetical protein
MTRSSLVVSASTDSKTGKPFNKCKGCQNNNEQESDEFEEAPLLLTGAKIKTETEEEMEDDKEQPLIPPHKY